MGSIRVGEYDGGCGAVLRGGIVGRCETCNVSLSKKNKLPKRVGVLQPLFSMVPIVKFGDLSENLKFSRARQLKQPADQKNPKKSQ